MRIEEKNLYINHELCKSCGGKCCLYSGCSYSPRDFKGMSLSSLKERLDSGYASIVAQFDVFEHNISYHLCVRSRSVGHDVVDLFSVKNTCAALNDKGCIFSDEMRPHGGLALVPKENFQCENHYPDKIAYQEWIPYQKVLERLVRLYTKMSSEEKLKEDVIQVAYLLAYQHTVVKEERLLWHADSFSRAERELFDTLNAIIPSYRKEIELGMTQAKNKLLQK